MESEDNGGGKTPKHQAQETQENVKLFVLSPSDLARIGLITKVENGQTVLMTAKKDNDLDTSTTLTQIISQKQSVNIRDIVTTETPPLKKASSSTQIATYSAKRSKRKISEEKKTELKQNTSESVSVSTNSGTTTASNSTNSIASSSPVISTHTKSAILAANCNKSALNNGSRTTSRRLLSGFVQFWLASLEEKGFIRCPLRACNYISLSFPDMSNHYAVCTGVSITSDHMCPVCQRRLKSSESVKIHLTLSHGPSTKTCPETIINNPTQREPNEEPPPRILIRKRGYSKVHKLSWTISLEQKGYIRCLFQNCKYLALTMEEMIRHYGICNGVFEVQPNLNFKSLISVDVEISPSSFA